VLHTVTTAAEWSMSFSFFGFFLTYIRDFQVKKKKKIVLDFFLVLGFELSCLHLEPLHQPLFLMMGFFEIESCKLFAWDGFKLQSS
jgi:hypothetical protein